MPHALRSQPLALVLCLATALGLGQSALAQELFSKLVGPVQVGAVANGPKANNKTVEVPYIFWGGDIATFLANGDLKTGQGSTYQQMGLDMQLCWPSAKLLVGQIPHAPGHDAHDRTGG